ncbi:hydrolase TatD [Clostridia bacterium]|nr:hydrolase TatD [Clostridia bacterium]
MNLFDTHAHLTDERLSGDFPSVRARMIEAGVTRCAAIGADEVTSRASVDLAREHDGIYAAIGVHPESADKCVELGWIRELAKDRHVVAIGEIGLDYHWEDNPSRNIQRDMLLRQLDIARELNLAAVLHVRDAHDDMIDLLKRTARTGGLPKLILHCFSGGVDEAKTYLDLGGMISFAGTVTYKTAENLREVARYVPRDRLLVETDCPYLAPAPMRGKTNEPAYVRFTADFLAGVIQMSADELADVTTANALAVFGISED